MMCLITIDNQQDATILIYLLQSALHVSGDVFAHHQEHITVTTASGNVHRWCCWLVLRKPHPTSWRPILILSTHLPLGLSSVLFPSGFPTKTLYTPLSSPHLA